MSVVDVQSFSHDDLVTSLIQDVSVMGTFFSPAAGREKLYNVRWFWRMPVFWIGVEFWKLCLLWFVSLRMNRSFLSYEKLICHFYYWAPFWPVIRSKFNQAMSQLRHTSIIKGAPGVWQQQHRQRQSYPKCKFMFYQSLQCAFPVWRTGRQIFLTDRTQGNGLSIRRSLTFKQINLR